MKIRFFLVALAAFAIGYYINALSQYNASSWNYGVDSRKGLRYYQEDRVVVVGNDTKFGLFGVFDGHGGYEASEFASKSFFPRFSHHLADSGIVREALKGALHDVEEQFMEMAKREGWSAGSTACTAVVTSESVVVANVGDSRAQICSASSSNEKLKAVELTRDHHPELPGERARIEAAGGHVIYTGRYYRVNGDLAMSRAIGDKEFKPYGVSAEPDVTVHDRSGFGAGYLLVLSDGIVEQMSSQDVCDTLTLLLNGKDGLSLDQLASGLVDKALQTGSTDNLSIIIVSL